MPHGGPPRQLAKGNSNVVFVTNVRDTMDAVNADGSPKWVDVATVTWEIRTEEQGGGVAIASGTATLLGDGVYACLLSSAIATLFGQDYVFRTIINFPSGHSADIDTPFKASGRTGETAYT